MSGPLPSFCHSSNTYYGRTRGRLSRKSFGGVTIRSRGRWMDLFEKTTRPTVVFTDGAAKGNPGPGGWGAIVVTAGGRVRELGGGSRHTTNNRMELTAPIQALAHLESLSGRVAIYTDSTYVIRGIQEWVPSWRRRGWRTMGGKDVLNRELWEHLWDLVQ